MGAPHEAEFCDFVTARGAALLRMAYLLTGDRGLAEDAVQSALARLYVAWPRIRRRDAVEAYVRTVITREVIGWRRRRRPIEVLSPMAALAATAGSEPEITTSRPASTDLAFEEVDERDRLRRALLTLPRAQRAVVVLRYFEDLTAAQVADVLGVAEGTVKSHNARALATLRQLLGDVPAGAEGDPI